jgi:hypothetical protein
MALRKSAQVKQRIHVYVATPAYDGRVLTDYAISLAESCQLATYMGINVTAGVMGNGAFIDLARNHFVDLFLKTDCTHLFFIDADLKWEARAFISLPQQPYDVTCGIYRRRQEHENYPVHWLPHKEGGLTVENGWVHCDKVPTGFLCIKRHVVEKMAAKARKITVENDGRMQGGIPQLFYTYINDEDKFVGEDFAWAQDYCKEFGKPIYAWPDFDFVHGGFKGNFHTWLNEQVKKEQAEDAALSTAA